MDNVEEALKELELEEFNDEALQIEELEVEKNLNCDCNLPYKIFWDITLDEFTFCCRAENCEDFYMSKKDAKEFVKQKISEQ